MMASDKDNCSPDDMTAADLKRELEETMKRVASSADIPHDNELDEIAELIKTEEERAKDPRRKPNIDNLSDAVVFLEDGTPVFVPDIDEKVIIERYTSLLPGRPWLDTRVYVVKGIDHDSGKLTLWDEEARYWATSNFIKGLSESYKFKLPPEIGRGIAKKRRRRTKEERELAKQEALERPKSKQKRGRKPGTKNRPKEVVAAEKLERAKIRAEAAAKRDLRKRIKQASTAVPLRTVAGGQTEKKSRKKGTRTTKVRVLKRRSKKTR